MTHICVSKLTTIVSDNGLSPGRRQAIIWTNAGILIIGHLGTNFNEILIEIYIFSSKKMRFKMSSGKWWPTRFGLSVLMHPIKWGGCVITTVCQDGQNGICNNLYIINTPPPPPILMHIICVKISIILQLHYSLLVSKAFCCYMRGLSGVNRSVVIKTAIEFSAWLWYKANLIIIKMAVLLSPWSYHPDFFFAIQY